MKKVYKYSIATKNGKVLEKELATREDAREAKGWYKNSNDLDVKIVQEVYTLQSERVVR